VFEADRQAHVVLRHAGRELFFGPELGMGCRRRMDRERSRVAYVGDVIEELQGVDELAARVLAALDLEADETALPAAQIFLRPLLAGAGLLLGVDHFRHWRLLGEPIRNREVVGAMALHAQGQRLDAL